MRLLSLALLLILPASAIAGKPCVPVVANRTSPCSADKYDQGGIMLDIRDGVEAYEKHETAVWQEKTLRKELLAILSAGGVLPPEKEADWKAAIRQRDAGKREMDYKLNLALQTTSKAYGLGQSKRLIASGPLKGYETSGNLVFLYAPKDEQGRYKPVYIEQPFKDEPKKTPHYMVAAFTDPEDPDAPIQAITLEDGSTVVSIEAFRLA